MVKRGPSARVGDRKIEIPKGLWIKCDSCKEIVYKDEVERNGNVRRIEYPMKRVDRG